MNSIESVSIGEFIQIFDESVLEHKNTDNPIPELFKDSISKVETCLSTPFQNVFGEELYPTVYDKGSILFYLFIKNHPLANGNKRLGYITLCYFLYKNGIELNLTNEEGYNLTKTVAKSNPSDKDSIIKLINKTIQNNMKKMYAKGGNVESDNAEKIADLKKRAQNKSLPASAVKKLNEMIAELEKAETKKEPMPKKKAEPTAKATPAKTVADDYDCDEIIKKAKERKAKQKLAVSKPAIVKDEKAVEKLGERIKKHYKEGELSKKQIVTLISELTDQLNELKKLLKNAK